MFEIIDAGILMADISRTSYKMRQSSIFLKLISMWKQSKINLYWAFAYNVCSMFSTLK